MADKDYYSRCINSDVIIYYRCYSDQTAFIEKLDSLGKLVIYDIDDYVFQNGGRFNTAHELKVINQYFNAANCYSASTQTLLDKFPKNDNPRFVRKNCINKQTFNILSSDKYRKENERFRVGWTVGINRREMQDFAIELLGLLDVPDMGIDFYYFGKMDDFYKRTKTFRNISCNRLNYIPTGQWKDLYKLFTLSNFDVVINPLDENDEFFSCKSEIKFIELGSMGVPLIVSRVKPFTEIITEGTNGFFASTPRDFAQKILYLKKNPMLARSVGLRAREDVKREYLVTSHANKFVTDCLTSMSQNKRMGGGKVSKSEYVEDICQDFFGFVTPPVLGPLVHEFKCKKDGLCRVEFLGKTIGRKENLPIKMIVRNKSDGFVVYDKVYNLRDLKDDEWWGFEFPPVSDSSNKIFEVSFIPVDPQADNTIAFYMHIKATDPNLFFMVSGDKKQGALAFKSFCSKFISLMPTKKRPVVKETNEFTELSTVVYHEKSNHPLRVKCLFKRMGEVDSLLGLLPVLKRYYEDTGNDIYVATNHQSLFKNISFIKGTIPWSENMAGIGKRFSLDDVEFQSPKEHVSDLFGKIVLGHTDFNKDIFLNDEHGDRSVVDNIISKNKLDSFIVLHQGVLKQNRTWVKEKWKQLEAHLLAQGNGLVVIGSGTDHPPAMSGSLDLVNKLTAHEAKVLISKSKMFIGVDGNYLAIAGTTDVPIAGIFMGTEGRFRFPYRRGSLGDGCIEISPKIECFGCWHSSVSPRSYNGCHKKTFLCRDLITPKMVLSRINSSWD